MDAIAVSIAVTAAMPFLCYLAHLAFGMWLVCKTGDSSSLVDGATYERSFHRRALPRDRPGDDDDPSPPTLRAA